MQAYHYEAASRSVLTTRPAAIIGRPALGEIQRNWRGLVESQKAIFKQRVNLPFDIHQAFNYMLGCLHTMSLPQPNVKEEAIAIPFS